MQTVQIHRERHEVVSMLVFCDYCHKPFESPDETLWMVWAEPVEHSSDEITTVPILHVHADPCLNDWLYQEKQQGPGKRLYGGCRPRDVGKKITKLSTFDPEQARAPTLSLANAQKWVDAMVCDNIRYLQRQQEEANNAEQ